MNYASEHPAPVPYSYSDEPEATLAVKSIKIPRKLPSLKGVVDTEVRNIRKEIQLGPYLEDDGHKLQGNIASYVEEIAGQQVAFIKYRTVGVNGGPRVLPA